MARPDDSAARSNEPATSDDPGGRDESVGSGFGPWRGPGPGRPDVPVPPERMPLLRGGRPRKSWTYVGAFGADFMLCAAVARIGVIPAAWWAVWDRAAGRLTQRTIRGHGITVAPDRVVVPGRIELALGDGAPVEVVSPHGAQYAWTRKRGGVLASGTVLGRHTTQRAIVDESAGYHARHTAWRWCAGVGIANGEPVAWNLVEGIHDAPGVSERTVWVGGVPHQVDAGVDALRFTAEATRARRENLLLVRSDYEQPFGTFAGTLPVAGPLTEGWGVMERHDVRW